MDCHWKHIHNSPPLHLISPIAKHLQIPRQCSTVTAHVHDSLRHHFQYRLQTGPVTPFPGWIHYNYIRRYPFLFIFLRKHFFRFSQQKLRISNTIINRIFSGIFDSLGDDLHSIHLSCAFCKEQGNCSYAAVQIPHGFFSSQSRIRKG
ncbi:hypothetical protein IMSAG249_00503 [Lachnospiraceae bacterium]|nr:hypothetical protein IMSAG249_00503 [Lachnospiraceae bacterium]